ncbi:unnamed protein product, partial [Prorocentrum cordatum]
APGPVGGAARAAMASGRAPCRRGAEERPLFAACLALCAFAASAGQVCVDVPWVDSSGRSCSTYELGYGSGPLCNKSGSYGYGWDDKFWGTFADWATDEHDASTACCACGGGLSTQASTAASTASRQMKSTINLTVDHVDRRMAVVCGAEYYDICGGSGYTLGCGSGCESGAPYTDVNCTCCCQAGNATLTSSSSTSTFSTTTGTSTSATNITESSSTILTSTSQTSPVSGTTSFTTTTGTSSASLSSTTEKQQYVCDVHECDK